MATESQDVEQAKERAKLTIFARLNWTDQQGKQLTKPDEMLQLAQAYKLLWETS